MTVKNKKLKGWQRERKTRDKLSKENYYTIRSAGSHGDIDIVGIYVGQDNNCPALRLVQSKSNGGYSNHDKESLRAILNLMRESMVVKNVVRFEIWDWHDYQRLPIITVIGFTKDADFIL